MKSRWFTMKHKKSVVYVTIPAGAHPGDSLTVLLPDDSGRTVSVKVPIGMTAGSIFEVECQPFLKRQIPTPPTSATPPVIVMAHSQPPLTAAPPVIVMAQPQPPVTAAPPVMVMAQPSVVTAVALPTIKKLHINIPPGTPIDEPLIIEVPDEPGRYLSINIPPNVTEFDVEYTPRPVVAKEVYRQSSQPTIPSFAQKEPRPKQPQWQSMVFTIPQEPQQPCQPNVVNLQEQLQVPLRQPIENLQEQQVPIVIEVAPLLPPQKAQQPRPPQQSQLSQQDLNGPQPDDFLSMGLDLFNVASTADQEFAGDHEENNDNNNKDARDNNDRASETEESETGRKDDDEHETDILLMNEYAQYNASVDLSASSTFVGPSASSTVFLDPGVYNCQAGTYDYDAAGFNKGDESFEGIKENGYDDVGNNNQSDAGNNKDEDDKVQETEEAKTDKTEEGEAVLCVASNCALYNVSVGPGASLTLVDPSTPSALVVPSAPSALIDQSTSSALVDPAGTYNCEAGKNYEALSNVYNEGVYQWGNPYAWTRENDYNDAGSNDHNDGEKNKDADNNVGETDESQTDTKEGGEGETLNNIWVASNYAQYNVSVDLGPPTALIDPSTSSALVDQSKSSALVNPDAYNHEGVYRWGNSYAWSEGNDHNDWGNNDHDDGVKHKDVVDETEVSDTDRMKDNEGESVNNVWVTNAYAQYNVSVDPGASLAVIDPNTPSALVDPSASSSPLVGLSTSSAPNVDSGSYNSEAGTNYEALSSVYDEDVYQWGNPYAWSKGNDHIDNNDAENDKVEDERAQETDRSTTNKTEDNESETINNVSVDLSASLTLVDPITPSALVDPSTPSALGNPGEYNDEESTSYEASTSTNDKGVNQEGETHRMDVDGDDESNYYNVPPEPIQDQINHGSSFPYNFAGDY